jgi:hypothetical protein
MIDLSLSSLPHTWIIDIDGTILKNNGHKEGHGDQLLCGVRDFWKRIPVEDTIILVSAREELYAEATLDFLRSNGLRYDQYIFGLPKGERILINDTKPSGLDTALAINVKRDQGLEELVLTCDK